MSSFIPHTHTHTHNDFKSQDFNHYLFLTYICITYIILTDHIITFNHYGVTVTQLTTFVSSYYCNNKKPEDGRSSGRNMLVRIYLIIYLMKTDVHFVGYLYIMEVN